MEFDRVDYNQSLIKAKQMETIKEAQTTEIKEDLDISKNRSSKENLLSKMSGIIKRNKSAEKSLSTEVIDKENDLIVNQIEVEDNTSISPVIFFTEVDYTIDEIKKFKNLFDIGIITNEEYVAVKKQLLGL